MSNNYCLNASLHEEMSGTIDNLGFEKGFLKCHEYKEFAILEQALQTISYRNEAKRDR